MGSAPSRPPRRPLRGGRGASGRADAGRRRPRRGAAAGRAGGRGRAVVRGRPPAQRRRALARGDRAAARRAMQTCLRQLDDLGVAPTEDTEIVLRRLLEAAGLRALAPPHTPRRADHPPGRRFRRTAAAGGTLARPPMPRTHAAATGPLGRPPCDERRRRVRGADFVCGSGRSGDRVRGEAVAGVGTGALREGDRVAVGVDGAQAGQACGILPARGRRPEQHLEHRAGGVDRVWNCGVVAGPLPRRHAGQADRGEHPAWIMFSYISRMNSGAAKCTRACRRCPPTPTPRAGGCGRTTGASPPPAGGTG